STYTTSGTFTDILQTWQGCDSTVILDLVVLPEITIIDTIITDGVDVPLGSIDITPSGNSANYQYIWSTGATTQDVTDLGTGFYSLTITNTQGCTDTFSFEIGTVTIFFVTEEQEINVQLYPNPIKENWIMTLEFSNNLSNDLIYQIVSINGKIVSTGKISKNELKSKIQAPQNSGVYYLQLLSNNKKIKTIPFIIEK
ncbi:MAG: T9SS type A sorting domain-containing protein, partial [Saprospiraceae bacterium]